MAGELFGEVSNPKVEIGSRTRYVLPVSIALHVVILGAALLVPLMAPGFVPSPQAVLAFAAPAPPPPQPPGPPTPAAHSTRAPTSDARSDAAPVAAPDLITAEGPPASSAPEGIGVVGGIEGGILAPSAAIARVPTPPPLPAAPQPLRPGGDIKAPIKIRHVPPVYPRLAQQAGVEGIVILEATIEVDGRVRDVRVLRSEPMLDQAAIDAVMQWRFTPTLLNGVPVPIIMSVTVHFTLREALIGFHLR